MDSPDKSENETESLKLALEFDAARLGKDLRNTERGSWIDHFVRENYSGEWNVLSLRSEKGSRDSIYANPAAGTVFEDTAILDSLPYFKEILDGFRCPITSARLMRLGAGSEIKEHRDHRLGFEDGEVRIHIPVETGPKVEFFLNRRRVIMAAGECWYLNLSLPHRVLNGGTEDRVHLVIDMVRNEWLEDLFVRSGFRVKPKPTGIADPNLREDNFDLVLAELKRQGAAPEIIAEMEALR